MILIIAEKSAQGQDILDALCCPPGSARMANGVGWGMSPQGQKLCVSATEGHAFELYEPHEYNPSWRFTTIADLPIIPAEFGFRLKSVFPSRVHQIATLSRQATEIVNACDAGREGEGIFHELAAELGWLNWKVPISRMWMSSLAPEAIVAAFQNRPNGLDRKFRQLAIASMVRREIDWIYGINGSRCVSHFIPRSDGLKVQSIGRVQTPVLKLIYDKSMARRQFRPIKFYQLFLRFRTPNGEFSATLINNPEDCVGQNTTMLADPAKASLLRSKVCTEALHWLCVDNVEQKEDAPPPPFNLVELQRSCSRLYHWSGRRTERAARRCYREHKAITYPGTESELLPQTLFDQAAKTFLWAFDLFHQEGRSLIEDEHVAFHPQYIVPDEEIEHDHHAIMPLQYRPPNTDPDSCLIWELVIKRFLTAMSPPAVVNACARRLVVDTGRDQYSAFCDEAVVVRPGWLMMEDFVGNTRGYGLSLREMLSKRWVTVDTPTADLVGATLHEGTTTIPELHSYDSVFGLMRVKKLGTAATRGEIVETLVDRKYVDPVKGFLDVSPEGARLCAALARRSPRTLTIELAEKCDADLERIEKGKRGASSREKLLSETEAEVLTMIRIFRANEGHEGGPVCPFSGEPIEDKGTFWFFPGLPKVNFPKVYSSRVMAPTDWLDVISAPPQKGVFFEGFRSSDGRSFETFLTFNPKARGKRYFRFRKG